MTPFFYCVSFSHPMAADLYPAQLAMVASVVVNLSGIITGALYLFLRSSRFSTIGPREYEETEQQRKTRLGIKIRKSSLSGFSNQMQQPLSPSWLYADGTNNQERPQREKHEEENIESPRQAPFDAAQASGSWTPTHPQSAYMPQEPASSQANGLRLDSPRPLFSATQQALLSPATAAALLPPPPGILGGSHRRDSSLASHATVQIGLRLSSVDDVPNRVPAQPDHPNKVHELGCPNQFGSISSRSTDQSGLRASPRQASSVYTTAAQAGPTPTPETPPMDEGIRLSPTVYSPDAQIRPLQIKSPISTSPGAAPTVGTAARPWPLSREAPSDLNNPTKSIGWI